MARPFKAAVVHATTPTSTGTLDVTSPGFGTPKGAIVLASRASSLGALEQDGAISWGVFDGTNKRCVMAYSEDGADPTAARNGASTGIVLGLVDPSSPIGIETKAQATSWVTDGLRLNFTTVGSTGWKFIVVLLGGDECECAVGDHTSTSPPDDVDVGFPPDFVLTNYMPTNDQSLAADVQFCPGIAVRGGNDSGHCAKIGVRNGLATSETKRGKFDNRVCITHVNAVGDTEDDATITAFLSDGFTVDSNVPSATLVPRFAYLAVRVTGTEVVGVSEVDDINSKAQPAGTEAYTWPGHRPAFVYVVQGANAGADFVNGGAVGIGVSDLRTSGCIVMTDENNEAAADTACLTSDSFMHMHGHNQAEFFEAVVDSQDDSGFTLDYLSIPNSNQRRMSGVSVEESFSLRGTAPGAAMAAGAAEADGELAGSAAGAATASGEAEADGDLAGGAAGAAALSGDLGGDGPLAGLSSGAATLAAVLGGDGALVGTAPGASTLTGIVEAVGALVGEASGAASLTGALESATAAIEFFYETLANDVRARFAAQVAAVEPLSTQYDNAGGFVKPAGAYARASIEWAEGAEIATGERNSYRLRGALVVSLYLPLDTGDGEAYRLADVVAAPFRSRSVSGVRYRVPYARKIGRIDDRWRLDVRCPFEADSLVARVAGSGSPMPDFEDVANTIRARMNTEIETPEGVPVHYDNAAFAKPDDSLWIRWTIVGGASFLAQYGGGTSGRTFRNPGVAVAEVYAPIDDGDGDALALADKIVAAFRAITVSGVLFRTPSVSSVGRSEDSKWWQVNVTCPFQADKVA